MNKLELTAGALILIMFFSAIFFIKENTIYDEETLNKKIEEMTNERNKSN